nr:hypothetical protein [Mucilaginibacter sp. E4BP6]
MVTKIEQSNFSNRLQIYENIFLNILLKMTRITYFTIQLK